MSGGRPPDLKTKLIGITYLNTKDSKNNLTAQVKSSIIKMKERLIYINIITSIFILLDIIIVSSESFNPHSISFLFAVMTVFYFLIAPIVSVIYIFVYSDDVYNRRIVLLLYYSNILFFILLLMTMIIAEMIGDTLSIVVIVVLLLLSVLNVLLLFKLKENSNNNFSINK